MRVNLKLALATLLSAALGGPAISYGQQYRYYSTSASSTATADCTGKAGCQNGCQNGCNNGCKNGCQNGCACEEEEEEEACDPARLFPEVCGWQVYGFINPSVNANAGKPGNGINGPVTFIDKEEGRLSQGYLIAERVADTGGCGFDWGGRFDMMYGTDYVFTQAAGLELHQNGTPHWNGPAAGPFRDYGLAIPQAYGELAFDDLSVKVGHFYTPIGYQVVPASGNFFVTQPYTFQYGEPFTHMGALGTWKYTDELTMYGGLVNGWDKVDATTDLISVLGGFLFAPEHGDYTLFLTGIAGEEDGIIVPTQGLRMLYSVVFTYNFTDKLQYIFQHDNGWQENGVAAGVDAEWYGANQYLFYTVNECWKLGARAEVFRDDDGVRLIAAPHRLLGAAGGFVNPVPAGLPGSLAGNYYEMAVGLNWTPHANLVIRPELRWDWSGGTILQPYDNFNKDSQFIAAVDAIIHF